MFLLMLALACDPATPAPSAVQADAPAQADAPDQAPAAEMTTPPYTLAQLQGACPAGRVDTFQVTDALGKITLNVLRFIQTDDTGATFLRLLQSQDGQPIGLPARRQSTWEQLRAHASFPADKTTHSPETVTVPAGTYASQHYTVQQDQAVVEFWFADELPGPPVKMIEHRGEHGDKTTVLLSHELESIP